MADGEEAASEHAGSAAPLPGLGVPSMDPSGPSPVAEKPEIVDGYYPGVPPAPPRAQPRRRVLTASRIIALAFLGLIAIGWIVTQVRHAHATPRDKAACSSTLTALSTPQTGVPIMVHDLQFTDDKTLLGIAGDMTTHIQQRNITALGDDLNRVIHRCNQISGDFKSGFQEFCDGHPGYCKETFHVGPF